MRADVPLATFEALVRDAIDELPEGVLEMLDNVVILVEERNADGQDLLGLYDGIDLTSRDGSYFGVLPDRIIIYREPHVRLCEDEDELCAEVDKTLKHEIGHYLGIDHDRMHDLGLT